MSITTQPDVCLLEIFDRVPITDLLKIDLVCTRWRSIKHSACARRRCLTFLVGEHPRSKLIQKSKFSPHLDATSVVEFQRMDQAFTRHLLDLFPNIKTLIISVHEISASTLVGIVDLLQICGERLISLELYIKCRSYRKMGTAPAPWVYDKFLDLFQAIVHSLPALKRLILDLSHFLYDEFPDQLLNQMPLLEQFNFRSKESINSFLPSLNRTLEPNLRKLGILTPISDYESIPKNNFDRFTHLAIEYAWGNVAEFADFCSKFTFLTYLSMNLAELTLVQLSNSLAALNQLETLNLKADFVEAFQSFSDENSIPAQEFLPLTSISRLKLTVRLNSHEELVSNHLYRIFPNLESILFRLHFEKCNACDLEPFDLAEQEQKSSCLEQLVQGCQLERFKQLKSIITVTGTQKERVNWI